MTIILVNPAKKTQNNDIWGLKSDGLKDGCLINKNRQPQIWQEFQLFIRQVEYLWTIIILQLLPHGRPCVTYIHLYHNLENYLSCFSLEFCASISSGTYVWVTNKFQFIPDLQNIKSEVKYFWAKWNMLIMYGLLVISLLITFSYTVSVNYGIQIRVHWTV